MIKRSIGGRLVVIEIREREPGLLAVARQLAELNPQWQEQLIQAVMSNCPSGSATVYAQSGNYDCECN